MISQKVKFCRWNKVKLITITNNKGLEVTLCSYAGSIFDVKLDGKTMVYSVPKLKNFMFNGMFYGKTLGRTAGRIENGQFEIDGTTYNLKTWGKHTLHGAGGLSFKNFVSKVKEDEDSYIVEFGVNSPDKELGYPGNLDVLVAYTIPKNENNILIEYVAKSDKDTIINLSNHVYWNLHGDIEKDCLNDLLLINASKYVDVNDELIFKEIKEVNEVMDFRIPKPINEDLFDEDMQRIAKGYDHDFVLDKEKKTAAKLSTNNITLEVETSLPIIHLYTGNYFKDEHRYHGVALECQKLNHDIKSLTLSKDKIYKEYILFKLTNATN